MAKKKQQALNALERAIATVSPTWAWNRQAARIKLEATGGYNGGSLRRTGLANFRPDTGDANAAIGFDLPVMRGRSRDLARNDPVACGAINTTVGNVIGTGLSMQSRIDADLLGLSEDEADAWQKQTTREYLLWAESTECDITRQQDMYGLQDLAFRSMLESGDTFAPLVSAPNNSVYKLAVQLIEADRVLNPAGKMNTDRMFEGIETDASGVPVRCHIARQHPGAFRRGALEFDAVPFFTASGRRNVIQLFDKKRPGQLRGVPHLTAVIEPLKQLNRYSSAELSAAVINATNAVFMRMDPEAFGDLFEGDERDAYIRAASGWDGKLPQADNGGEGKVINLLPGEEPVSPDMSRPNVNFDPFFNAICTQIGMALDLPREVLLKAFNSSYSASRAAMLDAWRIFRKRRDFMATYFCQPIYEAWLEEAVATGRVRAPGFFADPLYRRAWSGAVWVGDGPGSIDPLKEVNAAQARYDLGITTLDYESVMFDGVPWEIKHKQQTKERAARKAAGFSTEQAARQPREQLPPDTED